MLVRLYLSVSSVVLPDADGDFFCILLQEMSVMALSSRFSLLL